MHCSAAASSIHTTWGNANSSDVIDTIEAFCHQEKCTSSQVFDALELKKLLEAEPGCNVALAEKQWFCYLYKKHRIWMTADDRRIQMSITCQVNFQQVDESIQMIAALFAELMINVCYSGPLPLPEVFLKQHGHLIGHLDLRTHREVDDLALAEIIACCPKLTNLLLSSKKLLGHGLDAIATLQHLNVLNLCGSAPLTTLPQELPSTLEKILMTTSEPLNLPATWPKASLVSTHTYIVNFVGQ
jgi:hypothetical protein